MTASQDEPYAVVSMPLTEVLARWRPGSQGDDWTWEDEREALAGDPRRGLPREDDPHPILLGDDGRVWDGHHRLCEAWAADVERVPVALA